MAEARLPAEIFRRLMDLWSAGDIDALVELCAEDIVFRTSGAFLGLEREYLGRSGVRRFTEEFRGAWEELRLVPERIIEEGGFVVALWRFEGRGRDGIPVAQGRPSRSHRGRPDH